MMEFFSRGEMTGGIVLLAVGGITFLSALILTAVFVVTNKSAKDKLSERLDQEYSFRD
jgi:uncharacterized membrane protein (DUF485 family)